MASRGGYDGGSGAGGKIRRRPLSRGAAASPYARPAPGAPSRGGEGGGWFSRLIASGASRLFSSVFRKPPQPESLDAPPSQPQPIDGPPSPPPPPLEDDILEGEDNGGVIANNPPTDNPEKSAKDGDDVLSSVDHGAMDLEELLKQRIFTRNEFEYLAELLRSRTVGLNSLKPQVSNIKQMHPSEKENGPRDSKLPVDFSIKTYTVADQVASPAELAKAYMGSRSSKGSTLRLRLHDPSFLPTKSSEANTVQINKPPTLSLIPSSRLLASTHTGRLGSNHMTPNRSAIYKMSSSPYFKSAVSSRDLSGAVSSSYQTPSSVHTFGRQVLKRKSTALNSESVSVGPIRKMHQRYNRVSPLLETWPGYHGYFGSRASKLDEDVERSTRSQKRRCLDKVGDGTLGGVDNKAHDNSFGQAPAQSTEMAAKILKQLDTLVPSQKEATSEIMQEKHGNAMGVEDDLSQKKEGLAQSNLLESSASGVKEYSSANNINGAAKFTPAAIDGKSVDDTLDKSVVFTSRSTSEITSPKDSLGLDDSNGSLKVAFHQENNKIEKKQSLIPEHTAKSSGANKEKPTTFTSRSHAPSNLILSSEIDRNKMAASSNGFTFPVPAALSAHSQAPPTPTMASPPMLPVPVDKQQNPGQSNAPVASAESVPRMFKSVPEEGSIANKCDKKLNAQDVLNPSKSSGEVASFINPPVFSFANSKSTTLINGLACTLKSTASAVLPSNGSASIILSGSCTTSLPQYLFQSGFQTSATSVQKPGSTQVKAEAPFSRLSSSTGGSFTFSNTGTSSSSAASKIFSGATSQSVSAPSLVSSSAGRGSAPFSFSPQFGSTSSLAAQDKSKAGSSPSFSPKFDTVISLGAQDKSMAALTESTSGIQCAQSGNSNALFTQSSASNLSSVSAATSNFGSSSNFANPPSGSAPSGSSPFNSSAVFSFAAGPGSVTTLSSPATSSAFGPSSAFPSSPIFDYTLATTAPPSFGEDKVVTEFGSTSSPVFSFTSATPTIPNSSPTTLLFGRASPTAGLSTGTDQVNGGQMIGDKNQSPSSAAPSFGLPSSLSSTPLFSSPGTQLASTPLFSSPGTQLASTTSAAPGICQFGQQSQVSSGGGFSLGTGGGIDKSGRRILKVKRRK